MAIALPARMAGPPVEPLGPFRRGVREVGLTLITLGMIVLLFVSYQLFGTNLTEQNHQAALRRQFNQAVQTGHPSAAPTGTGTGTGAVGGSAGGSGGDSPTVGGAPAISTPGGGAVDHLVIPKIGVDKFVVEGTNEADLTQGPGHYAGTPLPGQVGNAAIAGHRTTYGAPFFRLDELSSGNDVYVTDTGGHTYRYQVYQSMVVSPSDGSVLDNTPDAQLTLTTCNPRFSATTRLIVKAKLVGLPAATTTRTPASNGGTANSTSPTATRPIAATLGGGNQTAWPPAIGFGVGVVLLWILTRLTINRTRRGRRFLAYLLGIAITAVPLWFCFENVVRLLPQSI